jgi:hypothetical protein
VTLLLCKKSVIRYIRCNGSSAAAMSTVMLDDPGSNPGVNHGCRYVFVSPNESILFSIKYFCSVSSVGQKFVDGNV